MTYTVRGLGIDWQETSDRSEALDNCRALSLTYIGRFIVVDEFQTIAAFEGGAPDDHFSEPPLSERAQGVPPSDSDDYFDSFDPRDP